MTVTGASAPAAGPLYKFEFLLAALVVFFLPWNFVRLSAVFLTLSDVIAFFCLGFMTINRTIHLRFLGGMTGLLIAGVVLLFAGLMVGSLVNGDPLRGLIVGGQYTFTYLFLPFLFLSRDKKQTVLLVKIFVVSIFLMCLHGIYMIYIDGTTHNKFVSGSGRLLGFIGAENEVAIIIALTIPLLFWLSTYRIIRPIWLALVFPIFVYGILLSGSNQGLIAMVYTLALCLVATASWKQLPIALILIGAFIVLIGPERAFLPEVFQTRVLGALDSGDLSQAGTFSSRYDLIVESIPMIDSSAFLGVGADQHRVLSQWGAPVHNAYLLIWSEGGVFALIGFCLIILALLVSTVRAAGHAQGWFTAVCGFSIVSTFAVVMNGAAHPYARFWVGPVYLGVALCMVLIRERQILRRFPRRNGDLVWKIPTNHDGSDTTRT